MSRYRLALTERLWKIAGSPSALDAYEAERMTTLENLDVAGRAQVFLSLECGRKLAEHVAYRPVFDPELEIPVRRGRRRRGGFAPQAVPKNLLGALWTQFAESMLGEHAYKRCGYCNKWFEISLLDGRERRRAYCKEVCKVLAYQRRQRGRSGRKRGGS